MKEMALTRRILAHAASTPNKAALWMGGEQMTYGELGKKSRHKVEVLSAWKKHHPVIFPGGRGADTVAGMLGCLLSGRPYVVLDPAAPVLRQNQIIQDVEDAGPDLPGLAYLMYTSGSTGRPKGVEITRDNLDFFLDATWDLPLEPPGEAVWLTHAPWNFDLSVLPLWQGLARGDRVVWLDTSRGTDFPCLGEEMAASGATCWVSTPSFARLWLRDPAFGREMLPRLSLFFFCGEILEPGLVLALMERFPRARVINAYGPTEATVAATLTRIPWELAEKGKPLPVGRPLAGVSIAIAGKRGEFLPEGQEGEILIGGPGVGRGYRGLPELTAGCFFSQDGLPWYRTGDLGRLEGGHLYFHRRRDLQVKRRGFRVELGDVEQNLLALPQVTGAAAGLVGDRLAALVATAPGYEAGASGLMRALGERLPPALMPQRILLTDALPLTPQGKLDREAVGRILWERMKGGRQDGRHGKPGAGDPGGGL